MTKPRTPPVGLVLLPALALAAVGVRAVTAEMRASEDAARERARSVASRLARSVDALVAEYAGPLPEAGASIALDVAEKTIAHLQPHVRYGAGDALKRSVSVPVDRREGIRHGLLAVEVAPARLSLGSDREFAADAALVRDALATADRLARDRAGGVAAAALLAAAVEAIHDPSSRWPLRHAEANHDLSVGDRDAAIAAIATAVNSSHLTSVEFEGRRYPEAALVIAADCIGREDPPPWFASAYTFCANRPSLLDADALDRIDRTLSPAFAARMRPLRRLASAALAINEASPTGAIAAVTLSTSGGEPVIAIWRSIDDPKDTWILLGGEIPRSVVEDRLGHEAHALAAEAGVVLVRLTNATGDHALDTAGASSKATNLVVETVALAEPLSSWRAEAVVAPESGVPATAWMLAGALVVTTAALLAGTLALRRAAERSARLAEDRQTFLDHVAHELRTPAAAVQALTEELASGHVTKEREPEYRRHLLRESRRLSSLVEDTLDLTRLDAGRLSFRMEPADLRDVVRRAIEESDGAGRVAASLPDAPVVRPVDEGMLRRAVKNLVENAVRHGGGDAPVTVALEASGGTASIVVADEGRGIAAEHLPRLFERFFRVPSATHEVKGVGLGLALCREVARAHGGDVTVESRVGEGSTFTLTVPLA